MPPKITRNHEYAKVLARTVKTNRGFTSLANKVDAIDSADVTQILSTISASTLEVYDTLDSLPTSSLTKGGQGYVKATQRLYVSDSFGWYSMALVNLTPTQTLDPSGNITLSTDGTSTIVTITATDSDQPESQLSYSVESDGNMLATGTTVTQDSSVFTITPLSEDSGGVAGDFTLTFKTTDSINIATTTKDFSLAFTTPPVSGSTSTIALMKASGSGKAHEGISYQNGSDPTLDIIGFSTTTGTPRASSFSPYREGGYSYYGDGTGDYLYVDLGASGGPDADYTIEFWTYYTNNNTNTGFFNMSATSGAWTSNSTTAIAIGKLDTRFVSYIGGGTTAISHYSINHSTLENTWVHLALVRNSNAITLYINGVAHATTGTQSSDLSSYRYLAIGGYYSASYLIPGYIRDFRYVKGTAVYTSDFTPPTEPLTAISGTQLLTCNLPYFGDKSTNAHSITVYGNAHTEPFGPYDYSPFAIQSDVGSTFLSTGVDGMAETTNHQTISNFGSSDFTIEMWYYPTVFANYQTLYTGRANNSLYGQLQFFVNSTGQLVVYASANGSTWMVAEAGTAIKVINQTWNHIALVRNGNTWTTYINGVGEVVSTNSGTLVNNTLLQIGYENNNVNSAAAGYISDYRIVKGTAVYTSNFTPPTAPLTWVTNTTLQLQNKWDTYVYDAAAAGRITLLGDAQSTTTQRKFTTSSALVFDGTTDGARFDELTPEYLGGDFTIQFWLYPTTWYNSGTVFGHWVGGQYHHFLIYSHTGTDWKLYASSNGSTWNLASAASVSIARWTNSWKHVAMTYDQSAGTVKFWLDGSLASTHTGITGLTSNTYTSSVLSVASDQNGSYVAYAGYVQDIKVSRSVEYTTNFTPPTTEFEL